MTDHTYNPSSQEARASLGNTARPCPKKTQSYGCGYYILE